MRWLVVVAFAALVVLGWHARPGATPRRQATPPAAGNPRPPTPARRSPIADGVRVTGLALTPARRPVASARVTLTALDGTARTTATDADGRFELVAAREAELRLTVRGPRGGLDRSVRVARRHHDLGRLVLRPFRPLRVRLTSDGRPAPGAVVAAWNGSGDRPVRTVSTDAGGEAAFDDLAERPLRVVAHAPGRGRATARVDDESRIELALRPTATLRVRVTTAAGEPVAGARVMAWEASSRKRPYWPPRTIRPTDTDGWTAIEGLADRERFRLRAIKDPFPPSSDFGTVARWPEAEVRLAQHTERRWRILPGDAPIPADGTRIRLVQSPGLSNHWAPAEGMMDDGWLVVAYCPTGFVSPYAIAPDGAIANLEYDNVDGVWGPQPSRFFRPRSLTVTLRHADGRPAEGFVLRLKGDDSSFGTGSRTTGARGVARWSGVLAPPRTILACENHASYRGVTVGRTDFGELHTRIEATLPEPEELVARVTIDGAPGLPARYELHAADEKPFVVAEDAAAGAIRFRLHRGPALTILRWGVDAAGFASARGETARGEPIAIPLRSTGVLPLRIRGRAFPSDLEIQRWEDDRWSWTGLGAHDAPSPKGDFVAVTGVTRGRYRAIHLDTGIASDPVDFDPRDARGGITLDLGVETWVAGRVSVPEGFSARDVRVEIEGAGTTAQPRRPADRWGREVGSDGRFRYRVPGDRPLVLRANHPLLRTANEARVSGSRTGISLVLARDPIVTLRVTPEPDFSAVNPRPPISRARWRDDGEFVGLVLYAGGRPVEGARLDYDDRVLRFRVPPRVDAAWLDVPGLAPLRVDVPADGGDLGDVRFEKGAVLRVEIDLAKGVSIRFGSVRAEAAEEPTYRRLARDGPPYVLRGLGPGRFTIRGRFTLGAPDGDAPARFERTVEVGRGENAVLRVRLP